MHIRGAREWRAGPMGKREEKKFEMLSGVCRVYCRVCVMREGAVVCVCGRRGFFIPF